MLKLFTRFQKLFAFIAILTLFTYIYVRFYYYFSYSGALGDRIFAILLLLAETHTIFHAFGFIIHTIKLARKRDKFKFADLDENNLPSVAVLVAAKDEPISLLEQTFITLMSLDYSNKHIYFLDGSKDPQIRKKNQEIATKYYIDYVLDYKGKYARSKANIINMQLPAIKEEYLVIFDADQNPMPEFLREVVSLIEADDKLAFVQTPQLYSNLSTSPIAKGSAMQQSIFYESICEAKGSMNAMFCCGTNVIFRTEVLKEVGGFDESSITEDFATSVRIHKKGYRSLYYNHVRVFGMAPESLPAYFKQQARWSAGVVGVLRTIIREFVRNPLALKLGQWWEYFLSSSYYFVGWAFFILMLGPIFYLLFERPSYYLEGWVYILTFVPYYVMTLTVSYATMKKRNYKAGDIVNGIILSNLSFPVLMVSTVNGLFNNRLKFNITPKGKSDQMSTLALLPWIVMLALNLAAAIIGILDFNDNPYAKIVNIFWCLYHALVLSQIVRYNKKPDLKDNVFKFLRNPDGKAQVRP